MEAEFEVNPEKLKELQDWANSEQGRGAAAVGLSFETTWCPKHLEPYRANWPMCAAAAMVKLFEAFVEDERAISMAGGDSLKLNAVMIECSPICCFISEDALKRVYEETGVSNG
jgi:hypothetical protein